jgi:hypothetical protein
LAVFTDTRAEVIPYKVVVIENVPCWTRTCAGSNSTTNTPTSTSPAPAFARVAVTVGGGAGR